MANVAQNLTIGQYEVVLGWNDDHTYFLVLYYHIGDISPSSTDRRFQIDARIEAVTPFDSMTGSSGETMTGFLRYVTPGGTILFEDHASGESMTFSNYSGRASLLRLYDTIYGTGQYWNYDVVYDIETTSGSWSGTVKAGTIGSRRERNSINECTAEVNGSTSQQQLEFGDSVDCEFSTLTYTNFCWADFTFIPDNEYSGEISIAENVPIGVTETHTIALSEINKLSTTITSTTGVIRVRMLRGETIDAYYPGTTEASYISQLFLVYAFNIASSSSISIPSNIVPVISSITVSEGATNFPAAIQNYVQGQSKLAVQTTAAALYGASIASIISVVEGNSYSGSSILSNTLSQSGSHTVRVTVKDSRGRSTTATRTVTVLAYSPPTITGAELYRCASALDTTEDTEGAFACIIPKGSVSSLNGQNAITCTVYYKKTSVSSYSMLTVACADFTLDTEYGIFSAEIGSGYDVYILLADRFNETRYYCVPLSATGALIHIRNNRKGMGVFQRAPGDGLWIAGDVHLTGMQHETATLASGGANSGLHSIAPKQYTANNFGSGVYIPIETYHISDTFVTLCIDTDTMKFGAYVYNETTGTGAFTAFT